MHYSSAFIQWSTEEKDSKRLGELLKSNCPYYVAYIPLEFYLATTYPDAFPRLFDWYAEARSGEAKKNLFLCLERAFDTLRFENLKSRHGDVNAFLTAAKAWYNENHSKTKVNKRYPHLISRYTTKDPEEQDLFVRQ
jgi:hypothetical protein